MLTIKPLITAAVLSGVAVVSFAQTPVAPKAAPAAATAAAPAVAEPTSGAAKKHVTKKVKRVKHVKAKADKPVTAASK